MAHQHSPGFLKLVGDAKRRIHEVTVDDVKSRLDRGERLVLVDVREESEWAKDHLPGGLRSGTLAHDGGRRAAGGARGALQLR